MADSLAEQLARMRNMQQYGYSKALDAENAQQTKIIQDKLAVQEARAQQQFTPPINIPAPQETYLDIPAQTQPLTPAQYQQQVADMNPEPQASLSTDTPTTSDKTPWYQAGLDMVAAPGVAVSAAKESIIPTADKLAGSVRQWWNEREAREAIKDSIKEQLLKQTSRTDIDAIWYRTGEKDKAYRQREEVKAVDKNWENFVYALRAGLIKPPKAKSFLGVKYSYAPYYGAYQEFLAKGLDNALDEPGAKKPIDHESEDDISQAIAQFERGQQAMPKNTYEDGSVLYHAHNIGTAAPQIGAAIATGGLTAAATRNPQAGFAAANALLAGTMGAEAYGEARQKGVDIDTANRYGAAYAATGLIPGMAVGKIMSATKAAALAGAKQGVLKSAAKGALHGALGMEIMTALQIGVDAGLIDEKASFEEAWQRLRDAGIVGGFYGGVAGAAEGLRANQSTSHFDDIADKRGLPNPDGPNSPQSGSSGGVSSGKPFPPAHLDIIRRYSPELAEEVARRQESPEVKAIGEMSAAELEAHLVSHFGAREAENNQPKSSPADTPKPFSAEELARMESSDARNARVAQEMLADKTRDTYTHQRAQETLARLREKYPEAETEPVAETPPEVAPEAMRQENASIQVEGVAQGENQGVKPENASPQTTPDAPVSEMRVQAVEPLTAGELALLESEAPVSARHAQAYQETLAQEQAKPKSLRNPARIESALSGLRKIREEAQHRGILPKPEPIPTDTPEGQTANKPPIEKQTPVDGKALLPTEKPLEGQAQDVATAKAETPTEDLPATSNEASQSPKADILPNGDNLTGAKRGHQHYQRLRGTLERIFGKKLAEQIRFDTTLPTGVEGKVHTEGLGITLNPDSILSTLKSVEGKTKGISQEARMLWVVWHELFHRGINIRGREAYARVLKAAGEHPFVREIARAIQAEREARYPYQKGERPETPDFRVTEKMAIEEALAEIAAAMQTGRLEALNERYGRYHQGDFAIPKNIQAVAELVRKAADTVRKILQQLFTKAFGQQQAQKAYQDVTKMTDAQVLDLLTDVLQANFEETKPHKNSTIPKEKAPAHEASPEASPRPAQASTPTQTTHKAATNIDFTPKPSEAKPPVIRDTPAQHTEQKSPTPERAETIGTIEDEIKTATQARAVVKRRKAKTLAEKIQHKKEIQTLTERMRQVRLHQHSFQDDVQAYQQGELSYSDLADKWGTIYPHALGIHSPTIVRDGKEDSEALTPEQAARRRFTGAERRTLKKAEANLTYFNAQHLAANEAMEHWKAVAKTEKDFVGKINAKVIKGKSAFGEALLKHYDKLDNAREFSVKMGEVNGIELRYVSAHELKKSRGAIQVLIPNEKDKQFVMYGEDRADQSASGLVDKIANRINDLPDYQEKTARAIKFYENERAQAQAHIGQPFAQEEELAQTRQARDELKLLIDEEIARKAQEAQTETQTDNSDSLGADFEAREAQDSGERFSISPETKKAYEKRIDELYSGDKPRLKGQVVLDNSDLLGLLGYPSKPMRLVESKVNAKKHESLVTKEMWKQAPYWLDNPAMVFDSASKDGRLVFYAPLLSKDRTPIRLVVSPSLDGNAYDVFLNMYATQGRDPFAEWIAEGKMRYAHTKNARAIFERSGLQLPSVSNISQARPILTQKDLYAYKKENAINSSDSSNHDDTERYSISPQGAPRHWRDKVNAGRIEKVKQTLKSREWREYAWDKLTDRMGELERIARRVDTPEAKALVRAARLYDGRVMHQLSQELEPKVKALADVVGKQAAVFRQRLPAYREETKASAVERLMLDVNTYIAAALHGRERNFEIELRTAGADKAGSGYSNAEIAALEAELTSADYGGTVLADFAKQLYREHLRPIIEASQQRLREAGLLTPEMEARYPDYEWYVPLYGAPELDEADIMHQIIRNSYGSSAASEKNDLLRNTTHEAKGRRGTKAHNVLETVFTQARAAIQRAEMQTLKARLLRFVQTEEGAAALRAQVQHHSLAEVTLEGINEEGEPDFKTVAGNPRTQSRGANDVVYQDGDDIWTITIDNVRALDAIRNINRDPVRHWSAKLAQSTTRFIASTFTRWNPTFLAINKFRDSQQMFFYLLADAPVGHMTTRKGLAGYGEAAKNLWQRKSLALNAARYNVQWTGAMGWSESFTHWLDRYGEHGGITKFTTFLGRDQLKNLEKEAKKAASWGQRWGSASLGFAGWAMAKASDMLELTTRVSAFRALVEQGVPEEQAAEYVKNTMNFETKGDWGANLGSLWAFFTTATYDMRRMGRLLRTKEGQLAFGLIFGVSYGLLQVFRGFAPKDVNGQSCYDRYDNATTNRYAIIPLRDTDGVMRCSGIHIPTGFGITMVATGLAANLDRLVHGGDFGTFMSDNFNTISSSMTPLPSTGRDFSEDFTGATVDKLLPTAVKPYIRHRENKDFRGAQIYADDRFRKLGDMDYDSGSIYTGDAPKQLAKWLYLGSGGHIDIAPETIQHYGREYTGGIYNTAADTLEFVLDVTGYGKTPVSHNLRGLPVVGGFVQTAPNNLSRDFYNDLETSTQQFSRTVNGFRHGKTAFANAAEKATAVSQQKRYQVLNDAHKQARQITKQIKALETSRQAAVEKATTLAQRKAIQAQAQSQERVLRDKLNQLYYQAVRQATNEEYHATRP